MIPKKLFCPKCLYPDRDIVFREDIKTFYSNYLKSCLFSKKTDKNDKENGNFNEENNEFNENRMLELYNLFVDINNFIPLESRLDKNEFLKKLLNNEISFDYSFFKEIWKKNGISLLHQVKNKEENTHEYYDCLYREIQIYLFPLNDDNFISKIFAIYMIYSLYFTQTHKIKFKIVTIPESLKAINNLINTLKISKFSIWKVIYAMTNKLYENQAFKITTLLGNRSIILNRYSLPIDSKTDIFNEYSNLLLSKKKLTEKSKEDSNYFDLIRKKSESYNKLKNNIISDIKSIFEDKQKDDNFNYTNNFDTSDELKMRNYLFSKDYYCSIISKEKAINLNLNPNLNPNNNSKVNYKSYIDLNNSVKAIKSDLSNCEEVIEILSSKRINRNINLDHVYTKEDLNKDSVTKLDLNINQYDYRYEFED